jgi:hypothetical protein
MNNKQKQIKFNQQKYYIKKYKKTKTISDVMEKINTGDIFSKILDNVVHRHNNYLKINNVSTEISPMEMLGCTKNEFKIYILSKLKENMTLNNYGEWQIDHIYPISKINFKDINEIIKYYNYTNLQPLDMIENMKKLNKIIN